MLRNCVSVARQMFCEGLSGGPWHVLHNPRLKSVSCELVVKLAVGEEYLVCGEALFSTTTCSIRDEDQKYPEVGAVKRTRGADGGALRGAGHLTYR
jgi:hypothetical protein